MTGLAWWARPKTLAASRAALPSPSGLRPLFRARHTQGEGARAGAHGFDVAGALQPVPVFAELRFLRGPTRGAGSAEHLARFPVREGDHILADRGYATAAGPPRSAAGGRITVPPGRCRCGPRAGRPTSLRRCPGWSAGAVGSWPVAAGGVRGRICAVRKSAQAAARARKTARREARRQGSEVPATLAYADFVIVNVLRRQLQRPRGSRMVPPALAGRTRLQAPQVAPGSATCPSATTTAPAPGCTENCS